MIKETLSDFIFEGIHVHGDLPVVKVKEHIQNAERRLKTELKIVEEFTDSDGYDLSDKTEEWKSGFRRAMLLVNNSINIYKYHKDKIFKECFGDDLK